MKHILKFFFILLLPVSASFPQSQHTVMTYNLLNYPGSDTTARNPYYRTIFSAIQPDILVVQEMSSQAGVDGFLNNVLNISSSGYSAGLFINGPDTDNAVFYKADRFDFIGNIPVQTALRDINEFRLVHKATEDTLIIYSVHLKAGTGSTNENLRASEVDSLRKRTTSLSAGSYFIVLGDFNIYNSNESSYQKLVDQVNAGYLIDSEPLTGTWNNSNYAPYHTQSTRTRSFNGGAGGGMNDRFDMILMSQSIIDEDGITFIPGSVIPYGNDGNHYNDSINHPFNTAVGQETADALHYASDHLPVYAAFTFNPSFVGISLTALIEGLYDKSSMVPDTVTVELRNASFPYALVDQAKIFLDENGNGSGKFYTAGNGVPYYLILKHRNALETWSAAGQTFLNNTLTYDFTTSSDKAYGNNLKLIGSRWCIYSGYVSQDGFIGVEDMEMVFTANILGAEGYIATDLNGDMFTEIDDVNIIFINNTLGIERKRPVDFPLE
jgi:endonuclease/exonuclease/phosphatase family metal-dependent hydrolase